MRRHFDFFFFTVVAHDASSLPGSTWSPPGVRTRGMAAKQTTQDSMSASSGVQVGLKTVVELWSPVQVKKPSNAMTVDLVGVMPNAAHSVPLHYQLKPPINGF